MKWMIASDIHGSAYWTKRLVARWKEERPDRVILLGDLLYHGPRNALPQEYDPQQVIALLSQIQPAPLCVRGNCDAEVDQMVLPFPIMADYGVIADGALTVLFTHGHLYNRQTPLPVRAGEVLLCGHFHVPELERQAEGWWYANPGSVSIPKDGSANQYLMLEDGTFTWKDMDGSTLCTRTLQAD